MSNEEKTMNSGTAEELEKDIPSEEQEAEPA